MLALQSTRTPFEWLQLAFLLFWPLVSMAILGSGVITLYARCSGHVPRFVQSLVLYGKFKSLASEDGQANCWLNRLNSLVRRLEMAKCCFRHFYLFSLLVNLTVVGWLLSSDHASGRTLSGASFSLVACQLVQCVRRLYETYFVSIYSDNTINMVHYVVGLAFYLSTGFATYQSIADYTPRSYCAGHFISNWTIFILFSAIQYHAHRTLARLRRRDDHDHDDDEGTSSTRNHYKVPRGGLFHYIACPHYLSEMVIYAVLVVFAQRHPTWLVLLGFVLVNQMVAGLLAHQWYRHRFGQAYPKTLKAIIPFVL